MVDIKFETPTERVVRSPFDKLPYCYVVGALENVLTEVQQNLFADCNTTLQLLRLRFSQSCLEQKLFYHTLAVTAVKQSPSGYWKHLRDIEFPDTVEPVLSGTELSSHPVLSGQSSEFISN